MPTGEQAQKLKQRIRPSASVRSFPLEGGLLLLDDFTSRLFAYNDTASHVWDLLGAGCAEEELAFELARTWGISLSRARGDIQSILTHWRIHGLLATNEMRAAPAPPETEASAERDRTSPPAQCASEWICTIGRTTIAFAVEIDLLSPIRAMLAHLETPGARSEARIVIRKGASNETVLILDGIERVRTRDHGVLLGGLWQAILERIHPNVEWLALIHGAAVARNGQGLALCGPSGSGKSTLTAGLISAGFDYLADDLVAVSAPGRTIVPWPVPISVKPNSFGVLMPYRPDVARAPIYRTKGMEARLLVPPPTAWDTNGVRLRCLIFPRFSDGTAAELQPLTTFQTIERLLTDRIWVGYPITADRVTALLSLLNDTPAYAAVYGGLADGMRLIEDVT